MRRLWYVGFLLLITANLTGCDWFKKHEDNSPKTPEQMLPPITQNGANTFGCLINGELMLAINKCQSGFCPPNPYFDPSIGFLVGGLMDTASNKSRFFTAIELKDVHRAGTYVLDTMINKRDTNNRLRNRIRVEKYPTVPYALDNGDTGTFCRGEVIITKWQGGQGAFASGTFWFDLYNPAKYADTIRVRSGRFDVPL